ncbi:hypothetical protein [Lichenifustis flavocetrariae]|uniref:Uncharacterized protein n=1 Tax=Lichenifustis flavocetrariae TaxID=2949735 RepID=A0AA41Z0D0_9HYPH|nr:hypothetical protein [Lichenifustis flavocetrariae]MCW6511871.1 hypothetical protein [Lichenifustis flavocetrariae]
MKSVVDIVRRLSVKLMLVAIVALALQAGGASAYAHGETGDCPNEFHLAQSTDGASNASFFEQAGVAHVPKAPCTSACCNVACSMAVLALPATIPFPASAPGTRHATVSTGAESIDLDGLSRPPRNSPAV